MEAAMLQKMFARGGRRHASQERIEEATERQSALEQQEVLRDRSALILGRIEKRKQEVRREALARKAAEKEEAERLAAEEQARDEEARLAAEKAETEAAEAADDPTESAQAADSMASEAEAPRSQDTSAFTESVTVSEQEPPTAEELFADPQADGHEAISDGNAGRDETASEELVTAEVSLDSAEYQEAEPVYAEAEPEYTEVEPVQHEVNQEYAEAAPIGEAPAHEMEPEREPPAAAESDAEADALIRQRAEEARARIAKRLEQMKAAEEAGAPRVELGIDIPPIDTGGEDHS
jgi:hypothetical protein